MKKIAINTSGGGLSLTVGVCIYAPLVAVWDTENTHSTMHIKPSEARRMARALLKAAERAEVAK